MSTLKEQMAFVSILHDKITQVTHSSFLQEQDMNIGTYTNKYRSISQAGNVYIEHSAEECSSYNSGDEAESSQSELYGVNVSGVTTPDLPTPTATLSPESHGAENSCVESSPVENHRRNLRAHARSNIQISPDYARIRLPSRTIVYSDSDASETAHTMVKHVSPFHYWELIHA